MAHSNELKEAAQKFYLAGYTLPEVAHRIKLQGAEVSTRTLREWRGQWSGLVRMPRIAAVEGLIASLNAKITTDELPRLVDRRELTNLLDERERLSKAQAQDLTQKLKERSQKTHLKKRKKNDFSGLKLDRTKAPKIYLHQKDFFEDQSEAAFWLKGRRLGFTYICAWRSLLRAVTEDTNQIFISASQNQAYIIRSFIRTLARSVFGVEMGTGDQLTLRSASGADVTLYFLGTNATTAQGYGGDLIIDEAAWVPRLKDILDTAAPMMAEQGFRLTLISTASYKSHFGYAIWEGDKGEDGQRLFKTMRREAVKASEAVAQGYDRLKWSKIKELFSPRQIAFLFECRWVDDGGSLFLVAALEACYHQQPNQKGELEPAPLPKYNPTEGFPVDLGFDPNGGGEGGDHASLVSLEDRGERLRVIQTKRYANKSIDWQVAQIKQEVTRTHARSLSIDTTGTGVQVYNLLENWIRELGWHCELVAQVYSLESKWDLVLHVERLIAVKRLEWDSEQKEIFQSFLAIRATTTDRGRATIKARRGGGLGHADLFWALSHGAARCPVQGSILNRGSGSGLGLSHTGGDSAPPLQGDEALHNLGLASDS